MFSFSKWVIIESVVLLLCPRFSETNQQLTMRKQRPRLWCLFIFPAGINELFSISYILVGNLVIVVVSLHIIVLLLITDAINFEKLPKLKKFVIYSLYFVSTLWKRASSGLEFHIVMNMK